MLIDPEDIAPQRAKPKQMDLQPMSVGELCDYIASLEAEIQRAQSMIDKKEAHKSGIEGLFKSP